MSDVERELAMVKYARRVMLMSQLTKVSQALYREKSPNRIRALLEEQKRIKGIIDYMDKRKL